MDSVDANPGRGELGAEPEAERGSVSPPPTLNLDIETYNFSHKNRGTCVIINNKTFDRRLTGQLDRDGTDVDADAVEKTFMRLGFDVVRFNDLNSLDMGINMRQIAEKDHEDEDCFVCVILSHGEEGQIYATNGKVPLERLIKPFKGDLCPSLAGKPKLFFIQACRGRKYDFGVEAEIHGAAGDEDEVDADPGTDVEIRRIPTEADFLMAYSVCPGYFSWRNNYDGSWFIQALCQVLDRHADSRELMHMMTCVNKAVAYDFQSCTDDEFTTGMKQMPSMVSMLTKLVYLKPKW